MAAVREGQEGKDFNARGVRMVCLIGKKKNEEELFDDHKENDQFWISNAYP